jgi:thioesterase domain-containing protein
MNDEDLQAYIYEHIPIVGKNGFTIRDADAPYVTVSGSLAEHINHRNSAFGGSLSTALILAAWATVRNILRANGYPEGVIVIQSQEVKFDLPVTADFTARVSPVSPDRLRRFVGMLAKFGKARLTLTAAIAQTGDDERRGETERRADPARRATFSGDFVVILKR